jgi:hypothetical protein
MRGIPLFNFPAFDEAKAKLELEGYVVCSPTDLDRERGFDPTTLPADHDWAVYPEEKICLSEIIQADVASILSCDVIYLLPGWRDSKGAQAELAIARWAGKEVIDSEPPAAAKPADPKYACGDRKPPTSCIPLTVLYYVGMGMYEGDWKYGAHNYRVCPVMVSTYYNSTRRHLDAYFEGEDLDPKSGLHHVIKAISGLMVLADAILQSEAGASNPFIDDRPPKSAVSMDKIEADFAKLQTRLLTEHPQKVMAYTEKPLPAEYQQLFRPNQTSMQ